MCNGINIFESKTIFFTGFRYLTESEARLNQSVWSGGISRRSHSGDYWCWLGEGLVRGNDVNFLQVISTHPSVGKVNPCQ